MGAFTNLFKIGDRQIPRIAILEAFAENPDDPLSAPDVIKITGVSRRASYMILKDLLDDGILAKVNKTSRSGAQSYILNPNDVRASNLALIENLLTIGAIESRIKEDAGIPQFDMLPQSIMAGDILSYHPGRKSNWSYHEEKAANAIISGRPHTAMIVDHIGQPCLYASASAATNGRSGWLGIDDAVIAMEAD